MRNVCDNDHVVGQREVPLQAEGKLLKYQSGIELSLQPHFMEIRSYNIVNCLLKFVVYSRYTESI